MYGPETIQCSFSSEGQRGRASHASARARDDADLS
jgi:hypothetical protein